MTRAKVICDNHSKLGSWYVSRFVGHLQRPNRGCGLSRDERLIYRALNRTPISFNSVVYAIAVAFRSYYQNHRPEEC